MLVLLGPTYVGTDTELSVLVSMTGLALYDLRTRLRPGAWSVVRAVADQAQAVELAGMIRDQGFQCCALDAAVGQDPARRIVYLRGIDVGPERVVLRLAEREMVVPRRALLTIVRGDVHWGRTPQSASLAAFSTSNRPNLGTAPLLPTSVATPDLFREQRGMTNHEVFVAADIHFVTVHWLARIDSRDCSYVGRDPLATNYAECLDRFIDDLALATNLRIDRHVKISSVASHTAGAPRLATPSTNGPISTRRGAASVDEHFDAYSRMIGEAERQTFAVR